MDDEKIEIIQRGGIGSDTTQIGIQNNYTGISPSDACDLAMKLFYDNFPKLQACAEETAKKRVEELSEEIVGKLQKSDVTNLEPFKDPDVQYVLFEAQKNYARFGTKEMLENLSDLIVKRVKYHEGDFVLKVAIDKAIEVVQMLTPEQLDLLSLLFICSRVKFDNINNIKSLESFFTLLNTAFQKADFSAIHYLNMLGCLQLFLFDPIEEHVRIYGFKKDEVEKICPNLIKNMQGDYSTSPMGTILAILNAEAKLGISFNGSVKLFL